MPRGRCQLRFACAYAHNACIHKLVGLYSLAFLSLASRWTALAFVAHLRQLLWVPVARQALPHRWEGTASQVSGRSRPDLALAPSCALLRAPLWLISVVRAIRAGCVTCGHCQHWHRRPCARSRLPTVRLTPAPALAPSPPPHTSAHTHVQPHADAGAGLALPFPQDTHVHTQSGLSQVQAQALVWTALSTQHTHVHIHARARAAFAGLSRRSLVESQLHQQPAAVTDAQVFLLVSVDTAIWRCTLPLVPPPPLFLAGMAAG